MGKWISLVCLSGQVIENKTVTTNNTPRASKTHHAGLAMRLVVRKYVLRRRVPLPDDPDTGSAWNCDSSSPVARTRDSAY